MRKSAGGVAVARSMVLLLVSMFLLLVPKEVMAQKKSDQGKPPKDEPSLTNPVLVYQRGYDLIVADETAQTSVVLHRLGGAGGTAAWSPNGRELVFVDLVEASGNCNAGWALVLLDVAGALDGTAVPRCLVNLAGQSIEVNSPAWSVNGIIYSDRVETAEGANWDLFVVDPYATSPTPLNLTATTDRDEEAPSWSSDGSRAVYVENVSGALDIRVGGFWSGDPPTFGPSFSLVAGTDLENVPYLYAPDWSNHGSLIVLEADDPADTAQERLWILDAENEGFLLNLTQDLAFGVGLPSWSGDDSRVVLLTDVENTCNFKRKDANGWQLAIMSSAEPVIGCLEAFIGPPGTNTKLDYPRSLDWFPGTTTQ